LAIPQHAKLERTSNLKKVLIHKLICRYDTLKSPTRLPEDPVYPTVAETVGAAIGLFVLMAAIFVLPLWMILRTAVWAARVLPSGRLQRHP
jgi:hypothetical protein